MVFFTAGIKVKFYILWNCIMHHKTEIYFCFIVLHLKLPNINKRGLRLFAPFCYILSLSVFAKAKGRGEREKNKLCQAVIPLPAPEQLSTTLSVYNLSFMTLTRAVIAVEGEGRGQKQRNSISVWWIRYVDNSADNRMTLFSLSLSLWLLKKTCRALQVS